MFLCSLCRELIEGEPIFFFTKYIPFFCIMENSISFDIYQYISISKTNIDLFIFKQDYQRAFSLFLYVIDKLEANPDEKRQFIDYYTKKLL